MTSPTGPDTSGGGGGGGPKLRVPSRRTPLSEVRDVFRMVGAVAVFIAESLQGRTA